MVELKETTRMRRSTLEMERRTMMRVEMRVGVMRRTRRTRVTDSRTTERIG